MLGVSNLVRDSLLFMGTLALTAAATPVAMRVALRFGLVDQPAEHKFHVRPSPYLGGLAVAGAVLAGLLASMATEPAVRLQLSVIAVAGTAIAAIGLVDDWMVLRARPRLAVQTLAAVALFSVGIRVGPPVPGLNLALTILVVLAITNAVNLLDNMDGLSTGTVGIACLALAVASAWQGQRLVSIMALGLAGACFGFLPYNFHPARIFLGDAGTLFMGFLLSTAVIKLELRGFPLVMRGAVPLIIVAVPLFDMVLVVISRVRAHRPVFRGGTDHSSHRMVALGLTAREACLVTYAAASICAGIALGLVRSRNQPLTLATLLVGGIVACALIWYLERVEPARFLVAVRADPQEQPLRVDAELPVFVEVPLLESGATAPLATRAVEAEQA